MTVTQSGNFKVYVYLGAIADSSPPATTISLDFSQSANSQYLSLFACGLIGKTGTTPPSSLNLDFSQASNSQYLALLSYGAIGK